jgi:menaquinone-dependent protoporphyrinogen oxidase
MRILVSTASKHGATAEIGDAIGQALRAGGADVVTLPPERVATLDGFDAVVLGSAVYAGRWLDSAKDFLARHEAALKSRPVWLFSSGPLGDPPMPAGDPADMASLRSFSAQEPRVFAGQLDKGGLGLVERAMVAAVRAPEGDFRQWDEIRAWAGEILAALQPVAPAP